MYVSTGKVYLHNVLESPASGLHPLGYPGGAEPVRLGTEDSPGQQVSESVGGQELGKEDS